MHTFCQRIFQTEVVVLLLMLLLLTAKYLCVCILHGLRWFSYKIHNYYALCTHKY